MRDGRRRREAGVFGLVMAIICSAVGSGALEATDGPVLALPVHYEAGQRPVAAAAGDLNGDGLVDLVFADAWQDKLKVMLNRGGGLFHPSMEDYSCGLRPGYVSLADVSGDGALDAVVTNVDTSSVAVLLGDGDGEFLHGIFRDTLDPPTATVLADLNGNGWLDLVAVTHAATVPVLLNSGDGSFAEAVEYPVGESAGPVLAVDVNRDGRTDLVTACASVDPGDRALLHVLHNGGDGQFEPAVSYEATGVAEVITSIVSEDFNDDGWPDVAFLAIDEEFDADGSLFVFLNEGDGGFGEAITHNAGVHPHTLVSADWNGDGSPDLALANWGFHLESGVSLFFNQGDGVFGERVFKPMGSRSSCLAEADLNSDGAPDLVVNGVPESFDVIKTVILENDGAGNFEPTEDRLLGNDFGSPLIVDVDGRDGLDLVRTGFFSYIFETYVAVALNNGAGAFASPAASREVARYPQNLVFGDLDKDNAIDAILSYGHYPNDSDGGAAVLLGDGTGGFLEATYYNIGNSGKYPTALGDLNSDGWLDLVQLKGTTDDQMGSFTVMLNDGTGTFGEAASYVVGSSPFDVQLVDLSGDGLLDVVVFGEQDDVEMLVFLNLGDATFGDPARYLERVRSRTFVTSDFDGDGSIDVALVNDLEQDLAIYWNDGMGAFDAIDRYATHGFRTNLVTADVNGDGWTDLVIGGRDQPVQVFYNEGDGSFGSSDLDGARGLVAVVDLDRDGYLDVVSSGAVAFYGDANGRFTHRNIGERAVGNPYGLACVDVNADNWLDVVLSSDHEMAVYVSLGDREFEQAEWYWIGDDGREAPYWIDVDGDGLSDAVVVASDEDVVQVYLNQCADPCIGDVDGDGDADQSDLGLLLASFGLLPDDPLFEPGADLTGDGVVDVADLAMLLADYECGVGRGN